MHENLEEVGGVSYTEDERKFAETIRESFTGEIPPLSSAAEVETFEVREERRVSLGFGDVSDELSALSPAFPTAGMRAATYVPGTPGHSWQAIASGGSSIGNKGMFVAAKTLTLTAVDLFESPKVLADAKAEWQRRVGPGFFYESLVGDRPPPLDYRKPATP
jgi:aminobenzoyl-glutamate utilization protein B